LQNVWATFATLPEFDSASAGISVGSKRKANFTGTDKPAKFTIGSFSNLRTRGLQPAVQTLLATLEQAQARNDIGARVWNCSLAAFCGFCHLQFASPLLFLEHCAGEQHPFDRCQVCHTLLAPQSRQLHLEKHFYGDRKSIKLLPTDQSSLLAAKRQAAALFERKSPNAERTCPLCVASFKEFKSMNDHLDAEHLTPTTAQPPSVGSLSDVFAQLGGNGWDLASALNASGGNQYNQAQVCESDVNSEEGEDEDEDEDSDEPAADVHSSTISATRNFGLSSGLQRDRHELLSAAHIDVSQDHTLMNMM